MRLSRIGTVEGCQTTLPFIPFILTSHYFISPSSIDSANDGYGDNGNRRADTEQLARAAGSSGHSGPRTIGCGASAAVGARVRRRPVLDFDATAFAIGARVRFAVEAVDAAFDDSGGKQSEEEEGEFHCPGCGCWDVRELC